jgi:hypothetical protein
MFMQLQNVDTSWIMRKIHTQYSLKTRLRRRYTTTITYMLHNRHNFLRVLGRSFYRYATHIKQAVRKNINLYEIINRSIYYE